MTYSHDKVFPFPFSGINRAIKFTTPVHCTIAIAFLARGCDKGHGHRYAVDPEKNTIYTTADGIVCLGNTLSRHKARITYYNDAKSKWDAK